MINNSEKPLISPKSRCVNPTVTFKKVNKQVNGQDSKLHLKKKEEFLVLYNRVVFIAGVLSLKMSSESGLRRLGGWGRVGGRRTGGLTGKSHKRLQRTARLNLLSSSSSSPPMGVGGVRGKKGGWWRRGAAKYIRSNRLSMLGGGGRH